MQKDRTARRTLALHPSDNVTQVTEYATEPLSAEAAAALERLERAFAPSTSQTRTARIQVLRQSIARRALTLIGVPADARILDVQRVGSVFIIANEEPGNRWAPYSVDAFRIPTVDDTDPDYETAPKVWCALAGWGGDTSDELPGMLAKATAYAAEVQGTGVAA